MSTNTFAWMRRGVLLLLLAGRGLAAVAQPTPTWDAAWSGGGAGSVRALGTASDAGGNVFVAGSFVGNNVAFGPFQLSVLPGGVGPANLNGFLVKYSPAGTVLWARQAGGTGSTGFQCVATDAAGNVYATGCFGGGTLTLGGLALPAGGYGQAFVAKFDSQGTPGWVSALGSTTANSDVYPDGLAVTPGGTVYVGGSFGGRLTAGSLTPLNTVNPGDYDGFLIKFDVQGVAQWSRALSGSNREFGTGVAVDAAGNPAVAGVFFGAGLTVGGTVLANAGAPGPGPGSYSPDIFLVKYDGQGAPLWARRAGGPGDDNCAGLAADASGNLYLAGGMDGAGGTAGGATIGAGAGGALLASYSPLGVGRWGRRENGGGYNKVAPDANNNLVVSGLLFGNATIGSQTLTSAGGADVLTARYTAGGAFVGAGREGGSGNDYAGGTCSDPGNGQTVVGITDSKTLAPGGTPLYSSGGSLDALVVKYAASGAVAFARLLGSGGGNDAVSGTAVDAQGNTYVAGTFTNNTQLGGVSLVTASRQGGFVAKYGPAGALLWARQLSSPNYVGTGGVALDAAGNLYVSGFFIGSLAAGGTALSSTGGATDAEAFLLKFDGQGTVLWARAAGGSGDDVAAAVAVSAAGVATLTGVFYGPTASFGGQVVTGAANGNGAGFLARYDAAGTAQWARSFFGTGPTARLGATTVAVDAAGNIGLAGDFSGNLTLGTTALSTNGQSAAFVARFDAQGAAQWARQAQHLTAAASSSGRGLAFDLVGNLGVAGQMRGATAFGAVALTPTAATGGLFLAKYDGTGAVLWARQSTGPARSEATALTADAAGNFYLSGSYGDGAATLGATTLPTAYGPTAVFVARYNSLGTLQWAVAPTSGSSGSADAMALGPNGTLVVAGTFAGYMQFVNSLAVQVSEYPGTDFFVARLGGAAPLAARPALAAAPADLFPNPAHAAATLRLPAPLAQAETLRLLDLLGREVRRQVVPARTREVVLDLAGLPAGVYEVLCGGTGQRLAVE